MHRFSRFGHAMMSRMKLFKAALLMSALLLFALVNGYADRLYTWTDAKGVTHITQDQAPDTGIRYGYFGY
jgi:hypothetical protein